MDTELTEEQVELVGAVRTLLERRAGSQAVRSAMDKDLDPGLWQTLAEEIGAAAIAIPEEFDGIGATAFESHLVLEALGEFLAPVPYFASAVIAAQTLLAAGDSEACARLLPEIASGHMIATLAWADAEGEWAPSSTAVSASRAGDDWLLEGTVPLVFDGMAATAFLVIAQTPSGPGIFEVTDPASVERVATPALDPTLRFASLTFTATSARQLASLEETALNRIRDTALIGISALQIGAATRGLDMTVEYAQQRVQFGRLIGSFQALKHRMADMHVALDTARSISRAAARALAANDPDTPRLAMMAKAYCTDALDLIASETIQLHGGIAITWEHDAHLVFKRAHALGQLFGQASDQRRRLARHLGLAG